MRKIHLHGALNKYGDSFDMNVVTAGEAVAALCVNLDGFMDEIRQGSWVIMRGDPETGLSLDEEAIAGMRLGDADLHIMPDVMGAKSGDSNVLKIIIGVTLIAVSFGSAAFLAAPISQALLGGATWGNAIGQLGLAMALGGVSGMLAPETQSESDDEKSYTISGPTSSTGQGHAIQIAYGGPIITGGMLVSGGIDANGLESVTEAPVTTPDPDEVTNDPINEGGPSY